MLRYIKYLTSECSCRTLECYDDVLKQHDADLINKCKSAQALVRLLERAKFKLKERYQSRTESWLGIRPWKCNRELVRIPSTFNILALDHIQLKK